MKVLDEINITPNKNCYICKGGGYVLYLNQDYDAKKFREARPCPRCMKQVVRIDEDG